MSPRTKQNSQNPPKLLRKMSDPAVEPLPSSEAVDDGCCCGCCCWLCCCEFCHESPSADGVFEKELPHSDVTVAEMKRLEKQHGIKPDPAMLLAAKRNQRLAPASFPAAATAAAAAIAPSSATAATASSPIKIILNVYHLIDPETNVKMLRRFGVGVFHAGVVIGKREFSFGIIEFDEAESSSSKNGASTAAAAPGARSETGVFVVEPGSAAGEGLFKSIDVGFAHLSPSQIDTILQRLRVEYAARDYHILGNNCVTFAEVLCRRLCTAQSKLLCPSWVGRIARIGDRMFPRKLSHWMIMRYVEGPEQQKEAAAAQQQKEQHSPTTTTPASAKRATTRKMDDSAIAVFGGEELDFDFFGDFGSIAVLSPSSAADLHDVIPPPLPEPTTTTPVKKNTATSGQDEDGVVVTPNGTRWTLHDGRSGAAETSGVSPQPKPAASTAAAAAAGGGGEGSPFNIIPRVHRHSVSRQRSLPPPSSAGGASAAAVSSPPSAAAVGIDFDFDEPLPPELHLDDGSGTSERIIIVGSPPKKQQAAKSQLEQLEVDAALLNKKHLDPAAGAFVAAATSAEVGSASPSVSPPSSRGGAFQIGSLDSPEPQQQQQRRRRIVSESSPPGVVATEKNCAKKYHQQQQQHFDDSSFDHVSAQHNQEMVQLWKQKLAREKQQKEKQEQQRQQEEENMAAASAPEGDDDSEGNASSDFENSEAKYGGSTAAGTGIGNIMMPVDDCADDDDVGAPVASCSLLSNKAAAPAVGSPTAREAPQQNNNKIHDGAVDDEGVEDASVDCPPPAAATDPDNASAASDVSSSPPTPSPSPLPRQEESNPQQQQQQQQQELLLLSVVGEAGVEQQQSASAGAAVAASTPLFSKGKQNENDRGGRCFSPDGMSSDEDLAAEAANVVVQNSQHRPPSAVVAVAAQRAADGDSRIPDDDDEDDHASPPVRSRHEFDSPEPSSIDNTAVEQPQHGGTAADEKTSSGDAKNKGRGNVCSVAGKVPTAAKEDPLTSEMMSPTFRPDEEPYPRRGSEDGAGNDEDDDMSSVRGASDSVAAAAASVRRSRLPDDVEQGSLRETDAAGAGHFGSTSGSMLLPDDDENNDTTQKQQQQQQQQRARGMKKSFSFDNERTVSIKMPETEVGEPTNRRATFAQLGRNLDAAATTVTGPLSMTGRDSDGDSSGGVMLAAGAGGADDAGDDITSSNRVEDDSMTIPR